MAQTRSVRIITLVVYLAVAGAVMIPLYRCTSGISDAMTAAPEPDRQLKGSVSIQGMDFLLVNNDNFDWTDCRFTVNYAASGGYDVKVPNVPAHANREIEATSLTAEDGTRFNPFTHKAKTVAIACSTTAGRAYGSIEFQ